MSSLLSLQKGASANLNNVAIKDGQLLVTTDTKKIYLDHNTTRLLLNDYPVKSVNGKTGTVSLSYSDVGAPSTTGTNASGTWGIAISGNAATATKLATARTISLTGDVTGSASFDGSANASITTTVADNRHNHTYYIISN